MLRRLSIITYFLIIVSIFIIALCIYSNGRRNATPSFTKILQQRTEDGIDIMFTFAKVKENSLFVLKFETCLTTLFEFTSVPLNLHIITDRSSKKVASKIVSTVHEKKSQSIPRLALKANFYYIEDIAKDVNSTLSTLRQYFSYKPGTYYSDALFFLSPSIHNIPTFSHIKTLIILDVDVKFQSDINDLFRHFKHFKSDSLIGMAYEQQPVYRHLLGQFRNDHPGTVIGDPPESGFPGFNSGVVLMNLTKLRDSSEYDSILNPQEIKRLSKKFKFKGHLGDQDFYTLLSFEYPQLFYVLPCSWNRQLCQWWKNNGYFNEFQSYHKCDQKIKLYHGNCNTLMPN